MYNSPTAEQVESLNTEDELRNVVKEYREVLAILGERKAAVREAQERATHIEEEMAKLQGNLHNEMSELHANRGKG